MARKNATDPARTVYTTKLEDSAKTVPCILFNGCVFVPKAKGGRRLTAFPKRVKDGVQVELKGTQQLTVKGLVDGKEVTETWMVTDYTQK